MSQYDVAVLGDGIAALVARLVLVQQCPELDVVTVRPPKPKVAIPKVGEHLPWAAQSLFEELGLWPSFTNQDYVQVNTGFSVWGSGLLQQQHTIGARRAGGWGVDRRHFEAWLAAEKSCLARRLASALESPNRGPLSYIIKSNLPFCNKRRT